MKQGPSCLSVIEEIIQPFSSPTSYSAIEVPYFIPRFLEGEEMLLTSFILIFPLVCYSCFVLMAEISLIVGAVLKL